MIVRRASASDAAAIAGLNNPVIRDTTITFTTQEKTEAGVAEAILGSGTYHVACEGQRLTGFACYFPFRNGPGYRHTKEHTIVIHPKARQSGAGRALMRAIEEQARGEGVHSMWAGVSAENPAGVAFHAAVGYTHVARLPEVGFKFGRWIDLVLMQKLL